MKTVKQMRQVAKLNNVKGYSRMTKAQLQQVLNAIDVLIVPEPKLNLPKIESNPFMSINTMLSLGCTDGYFGR